MKAVALSRPRPTSTGRALRRLWPLLALLAAGGCGGGGLDSGGAEPGAAVDAGELAGAALVPLRDVLELALDVSRFVTAAAPDLVARGAAQDDTLLLLRDRPGAFALQWFDADRDGVLTSGDGLRLSCASGTAPGRQRRGAGVHIPVISLQGASFSTPALYANLAGAAPDSAPVVLSGTLAVTYARNAIGERLTVNGGAAGFRRTNGHDGGAVIDHLGLAAELQPYAGVWTLSVRASLVHARLGPLTVETGTPVTGALAGDRLGAAGAGRLVVRRALGGAVTLLVVGPDKVLLWIDEDSDGRPERRVDTAWTALLGGA